MKEEEKKRKKKDEKLTNILIIAIGLVVLIWAGVTYYLVTSLGKDAGVIGDSFGAVNALFTSARRVCNACN